MDESGEGSDTGGDTLILETQDFEEVLRRNYQLFAVVGVFGALTVYLFNLRTAASSQLVDWGVAGALVMFLTASVTLVNNILDRVVTHDSVGWTFRTFTAALLVGTLGVMMGILGMVDRFLGEFVTLATFAILIAAFSVYLYIFPFDKFRDISNVPDDRAEQIRSAPSVASTWAVVAVLLSGLIIPELPTIDGQDPLILFPVLIIGIAVHFTMSFALRTYHLLRAE